MAEMIHTDQILSNDVISFTTYGSSIIPNVVNAKVLAIESGDGLVNPTQAAVNAANIYPAIPNAPGAILSRDYLSYRYFRLRLADGSQVEIAEPWINPVSLSRMVRSTATVVIHDFDPTQQQNLLSILAAKGFIKVEISVQ
jgi:hypothetical protein